MDIKTKRAIRYIIIVIVLIPAALFGIQTCSDSSGYTFHGEEINRMIFIPLAILAVVGLFIWWLVANKKSK